MTEPAESTAAPYRVVDARFFGWYLTSKDAPLYDPDWGTRRGLPRQQTLTQIEAVAGPVRPVEPISRADDRALRIIFDKAGRRTVTTLASALEQLFHEIREAHGGLANQGTGDSLGSYGVAEAALTAGRGGSWEADALKYVVFFGNELNLPTAKKGQDSSVDARRGRGPSRRVDRALRDELLAMLRRWVLGPGPYVELAEGLAAEVSMYADDMYGEGGWRGVADQWLMPGQALDKTNTYHCYRLLYSQSRHFNSDALSMLTS